MKTHIFPAHYLGHCMFQILLIGTLLCSTGLRAQSDVLSSPKKALFTPFCFSGYQLFSQAGRGLNGRVLIRDDRHHLSHASIYFLVKKSLENIMLCLEI